MPRYLCPSNAVTTVNVIAGFVALLIVPTKPALATGLVLSAATLDVVDGILARRIGGDHTFGAELDSLADLLCFCVVPAVAVYHWLPSDLMVPAAIAGGAVVLTGSWRLARFPLLRETTHFVGLPTPTSGVLIMALAWGTPSLVALAGSFILSGLGITKIRFPTVFTLGTWVRHRWGACRATRRVTQPHGPLRAVRIGARLNLTRRR